MQPDGSHCNNNNNYYNYNYNYNNDYTNLGLYFYHTVELFA